MSVKIEQQLETLIEQMRQLNEATEDLGVSLGKLVLAAGDPLSTVNAPRAKQAARETVSQAANRTRAEAVHNQLRFHADDYEGLTEFQKDVLSTYADKHNSDTLPATISSWEKEFMQDQLTKCLRYALSRKQAEVYEKVGNKLHRTPRVKEDVDRLDPTPPVTSNEKHEEDYFDDDIPF